MKNKLYRHKYDTNNHRFIQEVSNRLDIDYDIVRFVVYEYFKGLRSTFKEGNFERIILPEFASISISYKRFIWVILRYIWKVKELKRIFTPEKYQTEIIPTLKRLLNKRNEFVKHKSILKKNK